LTEEMTEQKANEIEMQGRGRWAGSPNGENTGVIRVNRAHGNGARWTGSPKGENAGVIRVKIERHRWPEPEMAKMMGISVALSITMSQASRAT